MQLEVANETIKDLEADKRILIMDSNVVEGTISRLNDKIEVIDRERDQLKVLLANAISTAKGLEENISFVNRDRTILQERVSHLFADGNLKDLLISKLRGRIAQLVGQVDPELYDTKAHKQRAADLEKVLSDLRKSINNTIGKEERN